MAKVINLKSKDDITSVIERLWETGEDEVYLVAPKESALLKNIIAMKLLKREADRIGKEIFLITKDAVSRETAKRVGLPSKAVLPKQALEEKVEEEGEQEVFKQVPEAKFESMLEDEVKARRGAPSGGRRFSDIQPKKITIKHRSAEIKEEEEIVSPVEEEAGKEEKSSFLEELISKNNSLEDDYFANDKVGGEEDEESADEESVDDIEENSEEDFPIHGLSAGGRRILVKEKKSFFDRLPPLGVREVGQAFEKEEDEPEEAFAEGRRIRRRLAIPFFSGKFLALFGGLAVLVALLALYFILPKAEVFITPKAEAVDQTLSIAADKGISKIDFTQNKIPAQLIKLDKRQSQDFAATGQRQVNDKAKGSVTVYNEYSSSPQSLVEKTRLVSEGGKIFRLVKTITVPGAKISEGKIVASSIDVEVVADQPGNEYNIGPGRFTIPGFQGTPKYSAFYGQSKAAMSGGASGFLKVVTQDDYDKARNELWQSLRPALDSEFNSQLPQGLKMIDGARKEEISNIESDIAVGSPGEKFTMTLKGTATVVLFDEKDVSEIVEKKLADKLSKDDLSLADGKIDYRLASVDFARGQINMKVVVSGKLVWKIDVDSLKREISGQNENAIRNIFNKHSEVSEVKISFWPFWVSRVPSNFDKIIIKVNR